MKRRRIHLISRDKAITLAMNHNGVERTIAEKYTNSELKEVLANISREARTFRLVADF
jgi:hypothetical protein